MTSARSGRLAVRTALVTIVFFALLEAFGARQFVSALSGTVTSHGALFLGLLYAVTFFAVVVVVPPLLVTGLLSRRFQ